MHLSSFGMRCSHVPLLLLPLVYGHGILVDPPPRAGMSARPGPKLALNEALKVTCGLQGQNCQGSDTGGPAAATKTYQAGSTITVQWDNTIPHDADILTQGASRKPTPAQSAS